MTTLSTLELFWVLYTYFGSSAIGAYLADAIDDREYARRAKENRLSKVTMANQHVRTGLAFHLFAFLFFLAGFAAALSPETQRTIDPLVTSPYLIMLSLIGPFCIVTLTFMILHSVLSKRERKALIRQRLGDVAALMRHEAEQPKASGEAVSTLEAPLAGITEQEQE